jgi:hypothetical protein
LRAAARRARPTFLKGFDLPVDFTRLFDKSNPSGATHPNPIHLWLNSSMITIRPIREEDIQAAKRVILSVAYNVFGFDGTLEDCLRHFVAAGKLKDMDDLQAVRALAFYRMVGFYEIPCYNDGVGEVSMELGLS